MAIDKWRNAGVGRRFQFSTLVDKVLDTWALCESLGLVDRDGDGRVWEAQGWRLWWLWHRRKESR